MFSILEPGCDEEMVGYIPSGKATKKKDGAIFSFSCDVGGVLDGPSMVYCDGSEWSSSPPQCLSKSIFKTSGNFIDCNRSCLTAN